HLSTAENKLHICIHTCMLSDTGLINVMSAIYVSHESTMFQSVNYVCTGNDVIQIINANYGRTDSTTCSHGLPDTILADTNCYASGTLSIVATKCNGKSSCTVQASNTTFKDPCFGTSKYLTVSHHCLPHPTSVTCEGDNAVLTCAGVLNIHNANYGRTDSTVSPNKPKSQFMSVQRCEGKSSCVVPATNSVFSDPCYGTYKYLSIKYSLRHFCFEVDSVVKWHDMICLEGF
uniref:SUEL-type lectin domain-containing protein n=1 Tax=Electrophorus electricus TaxID=8005 RepID=A0A4W4E0M5_ELEEL